MIERKHVWETWTPTYYSDNRDCAVGEKIHHVRLDALERELHKSLDRLHARLCRTQEDCKFVNECFKNLELVFKRGV